MNKIKHFFESIGFSNVKDAELPYSYDQNDYKITDDQKKVEAHKNYLKNIEEGENNRLIIIEGKTFQLISQTSIIFSLLSLFVPVLVDKLVDIEIFIKILFIVLLIMAFSFYMLTIINGLKNFNIKNFNYSIPAPKNVLNLQDKELSTFFNEEVQDLLYCINNNTKVNNEKATNLLHSYASFRIANMTIGCLVIFFSVVLLFFLPKQELKNEDKLNKALVSSINALTKSILKKRDTVYFKEIVSNIKDTTILNRSFIKRSKIK